MKCHCCDNNIKQTSQSVITCKNHGPNIFITTCFSSNGSSEETTVCIYYRKDIKSFGFDGGNDTYVIVINHESKLAEFGKFINFSYSNIRNIDYQYSIKSNLIKDIISYVNLLCFT